MSDVEPTYYNIGKINENGLSQGDIVKALYNLYQAVYALCNNLDTDAGTLGTDFLATIGTDLATAMAGLGTPKASHGTT